MVDEVHTDCPDCGAEIPFYRTVDELQACPECGTKKEDLFDLAMQQVPASESGIAAAVTDGGMLEGSDD